MNTPRRGSTAKGGAAMLAALALGGCALFSKPPVEYVPYQVKVLVETPCAAQLPTEPKYATDRVKKADEIDVKVDAVMAERQQRMGYEDKLRAAVKGCQ